MFNVYVLFLIISGAAMLGMSGVRKGQLTMSRIWNAILGAAFLLYGLYLLVIFQGGHYLMFYYVFVVPILMVVRFFCGRAAYRSQQQMAGPATPLPYPPYGMPDGQAGEGQQPAGYGQPTSPPSSS